MADDLSNQLEAQYYGFKASFGGEELKRACATLSGALVGGKPKTALAALAEDSDLHVRELAFAARVYDAASPEGPRDYDGLYNQGLVLQELSGRLPAASAEQVELLNQACAKYAGALALRPASPAALYNWGVALSDLARAVRGASLSAAAAHLAAASQKYAASLQYAPRNPQALNNWGLVLQELSSEAKDWWERDTLVRAAMGKFRLALRSRPDFDRGAYNLGTVFYTFALALQSEPGQPKDAASRQLRDARVRQLLAMAAQYICVAHALQPSKEIYRKSLGVVRQMLPLPFLRAGYLSAPAAATLGTAAEVYRRDWFVLDHVSLRAANNMESTLSSASVGAMSAQRGVPHQPAPDADPLVLPLEEVLDVQRCDDPSLPPGGALWVSLRGRPLGVYLVAEDADAADAWVDALLLAHHLVASRSQEGLAEALLPQAGRRRTGGVA